MDYDYGSKSIYSFKMKNIINKKKVYSTYSTSFKGLFGS